MKSIEVFDFDGTLCRTPCDTPENRKKYEKSAGIPWLISKEESRELSRRHGKFIGMRKGWWGRKETLQWPLVPDPIPQSMFIKETCEAFQASKINSDVLTLIATGRHGGLRSHVLRILHAGKLANINVKHSKDGEQYFEWADADASIYFLGDNGPAPKGDKPSETLPWKVWILGQFVEIHPEVEKIELWEDRADHAEEFKKLDQKFQREVIVNFVC